MRTVKLQVDGMTCAGCAKSVEKALCAVNGVEEASVNFISKTAVISVQDAAANEQSLIAAVKRAGYSARLPVRDRETDENRVARLELIKVIGIGTLLLIGWLLGATKLVPAPIATGMVIVALVLAAYPIFVHSPLKRCSQKGWTPMCSCPSLSSPHHRSANSSPPPK